MSASAMAAMGTTATTALGASRGETTGVVLMNLGGPDRPESVRPFLLNLFRDPEVLRLPGGAPVRRAFAWLIATLRAPKARRIYDEIGGSPLLACTKAQERALESRLNEVAASDDAEHDAPPFVVRTAMRCWHPRAEQAVDELVAAGAWRLVALPLYPHSCRATSGSSVKELRAVLARRAPDLPLQVVGSYARDERYLAALARCVDEAIVNARADASGGANGHGGMPALLFSAHGLPQRIVDEGDPYVDEIRATVAGVTARLRESCGEPLLSFQSRVGPVRWLAPSTATTIARLGGEGVRSLVIVPVSFVSDHIETVHEIDVVLAAAARAAGITSFVRSEALGVRPDFVDALARLVLDDAVRSERLDERVAAG